MKPLSKLHRSLIRPSVDRVLQKELGLIPVAQTEPNDVFIVGYPKSGHTWFQNLGAGLLYGVSVEAATDVLIQELVPDLQGRGYYKRYSPVMMFKTHDLPKPEYKRVIYLIRDGRDVLVSYLKYIQNHTGKEVDAIAAARTGEGLNNQRWQDHIEQWMANPFKAQMLIIKYEDLKKDAVKELRRTCDFMGIQRTDEQLAKIAQGSSFENMRRSEATFGRDNHKDWPKDKFFVRRGIVGSYKDELDPAALKVFEESARPMLEKLGYR